MLLIKTKRSMNLLIVSFSRNHSDDYLWYVFLRSLNTTENKFASHVSNGRKRDHKPKKFFG